MLSFISSTLLEEIVHYQS